MLRQRSGKNASSSSLSTPEEHEVEQESQQQHQRNDSISSIKSIHDAKVADRIAELERELVVAKEEQNAMKEELDKVKQHGEVYKGTIEDYRRQLSSTYTRSPRSTSPVQGSIHMDYDQDTPAQQSNKQHDLMEQNYKLRQRVAELQDQIVEQDSVYQVKLDQAASHRDAEWNELAGRLHNSEKESQERLQQLLDLKHSISAFTRMENQVTDSELAERIDQLYHRIREWVISNFRRTKLDFRNVSSDIAEALRIIYPKYETITSSDRLAFYQSIIANTLMQIFREPTCVGLPQVGPLATIRQLATYIHDAGSEYREWRRTTIRALEKSEARHELQQEREKQLHRTADYIRDQLFSVTSASLAPSAQVSLLSILHAAADLQHTLLLQKAQYKILFFCRNEVSEIIFDEERMESVNDIDSMDEDDDTSSQQGFAFCVFPCLEKFGDEFGEKTEVRNVLLKARVCSGVG